MKACNKKKVERLRKIKEIVGDSVRISWGTKPEPGYWCIGIHGALRDVQWAEKQIRDHYIDLHYEVFSERADTGYYLHISMDKLY